MVKMKWLGTINLYFAVCAVLLLVFLINKKDVLTKDVPVPQQTYVAEALPTLEEVVGEERPGFDVADLIVSDEEKIANGKKIYGEKCAACHGAEGKGDGSPLNPAPRNFHSLEGWTFGPELSNIFATLTNGSPGTAMSSFSTLPVEERVNLALFIQTLADGYPTPGESDVADLEERFQLHIGKKTKGQIPVESAMEALAYENEEELNEELVAAVSFASKKELVARLLSKSEDWKDGVNELVRYLAPYKGIAGIQALGSLEADQLSSIHAGLLAAAGDSEGESEEEEDSEE